MWCRSKKLHVTLFMLHSCVRVSITSPRRCPPLLPPASCNPNSLPKFSLIALSINSGLTCCGGGGEYPSRGSGLGTSAVWPQDADTTLHTISCGIKLQASCSRWYSFKLHCILWSLRTKWSLGMLSASPPCHCQGPGGDQRYAADKLVTPHQSSVFHPPDTWSLIVTWEPIGLQWRFPSFVIYHQFCRF